MSQRSWQSDKGSESDFEYIVEPVVSNECLNELFLQSWPEHQSTDFTRIHEHSLTFVCALSGDLLVGYVNLAWDGGVHGFLLNPTVHPDFRRRGVGRELVLRVLTVAEERGLHWIHVDYEPQLAAFYAACGFRPTNAGLIRCGDRRSSAAPSR